MNENEVYILHPNVAFIKEVGSLRREEEAGLRLIFRGVQSSFPIGLMNDSRDIQIVLPRAKKLLRRQLFVKPFVLTTRRLTVCKSERV